MVRIKQYHNEDDPTSVEWRENARYKGGPISQVTQDHLDDIRCLVRQRIAIIEMRIARRNTKRR